MSSRSFVISIIGRPNVGKSSLFNRLMRKANKTITHNMPGVTRDRHYGITTFDSLHDEEEVEAILIDTGGFYPEKIEEKNFENEKDRISKKFFNIMKEHAEMAIEESDLILLMVDVREGVIPFDQNIVRYLRTVKKDFWLVINKYDSDKQVGEDAEFFSLGVDYEKMFTISAAHGIGMGDLQDKLHEKTITFIAKTIEDGSNLDLSKLQKGVTPREEVVSRLAIIGAPNSGKSTLLNRLIGANRALVSSIPGTTVDPIEGFFDMYFGEDVAHLKSQYDSISTDDLLSKNYEEFRKNNQDFQLAMQDMDELDNSDLELEDSSVFDEEALKNEEDELERLEIQLDDKEPQVELKDREEDSSGSYWRTFHIVDTAGIRRKKSINDYVESQSVFRSLKCINEAEIIIYMVDATLGIGHQDRRLLDIALEKGKSIILCLNKVDLLSEKLKDKRSKKEWLTDMRRDIPWLSYCDLVPASAKLNKNIQKLKKIIKKTVLVRRTKIPTSRLNEVIYELVDRHPIIVKHSQGRRFKVKYSSMVKNNPPTFLLYSNKSKSIPDAYRKYLQNGIRKSFELDNTPIHLIFRTGNDLIRREKRRSRATKEL